MGDRGNRQPAGLMAAMRQWSAPVRVAALIGALVVALLGVTAVRAAAAGNAPVAGRDVERTNKGVQVYVNAKANDFDPDGDAFSIISVATPAHGTITSFNTNGFYYTPEATFSGTETITYTIRDSELLSANGTVFVQVDSSTTGAGAPTPQTDYFVTPEATSVGFAASDLAANDTDPQGQASTLVAVSDSSNSGAVTGTGPFTFTPRSGFVGQDTIEYLVVDPDGHVGVGTVYVQVLAAGDTNQAPVARRDVERTNKGVQVFVTATANDSDPDGDSFSVVSVDTPAHGTVIVAVRTTSITRRRRTFSGTETITYTVRDSGGLLGTGTVTVWVDTSETGAGAPTPQTDYFVTTGGHSVGVHRRPVGRQRHRPDR